MKKKIPYVSIIIGYHKKKIFFKKTIQSILKQTYQNFEIIVIYDDQDLSELNFVKNILKKKLKSKIIINKKNIGAGFSRNKGIHEARGKYVAFCDADDLWHKDKLKIQIHFMEEKKINFSHTSYKVINNKEKILGKFNILNRLDYKTLLKSCDIATSSVMIKKNFINNKYFFSRSVTKEDYFLWLKIIKKEKYLYGIDNCLLMWRSTKNSLSDSIFQKLTDAFKLYNTHEKYNSIFSLYYVIRLSFYALIKKLKIYR
jgi:teichuronic acid biosynthesis glycosyltransferase TuaG